MVDEDVAPSRAELEAWLWSYKEKKSKKSDIKDDLIKYLRSRNVSNEGIGKVLADIGSYKNYPKEVDG